MESLNDQTQLLIARMIVKVFPNQHFGIATAGHHKPHIEVIPFGRVQQLRKVELIVQHNDPF
jgi:hypothetical protein